MPAPDTLLIPVPLVKVTVNNSVNVTVAVRFAVILVEDPLTLVPAFTAVVVLDVPHTKLYFAPLVDVVNFAVGVKVVPYLKV